MALHDEGERRAVTYENARAVLEAQLEIVRNVDSKAVRTVRVTILLVGIVLSASQVRPELFDATLTFLSALSTRARKAPERRVHTDSTGWLAYNSTYSAAFSSTSPGSPLSGSRGMTRKSASTSSAVSSTALPGCWVFLVVEKP